MELTLIRHGQSEANVTGHWQGQGDSPLTAHGQEQAKRLGQRLAGQSPEHVFASDLKRAYGTARALSDRVTQDPIWREIDVGAWEGLTREEARTRYPEQVVALAEGALDVAIGGGESWQDLLQRSTKAFRALSASHGGKRVIVVSHGGLISTLTSALFGLSMQRPRPLGRLTNTSMTTLRETPEGLRLARFNDTLHLHDLDHGRDDPQLVAEASSAGTVAGTLEALDAARVAATGRPLQLAPPQFDSLIANVLGCEARQLSPSAPGSRARIGVAEARPQLLELLPGDTNPT